MNVLANDGISDEGKKTLQQAGFNVLTKKVDQVNLIDYINKNKVEIILVRSATTVRKDVVDACPSLRLIGRGGVGMDNIDVNYAREKGITVINTPAASSQSVAELVMGYLFAGARSLHHSFKHMEHTEFNVLKKKYANGSELRGKTLLIIGFGRIGQALAGYALGCGMRVVATNLVPETIQISLGNIQHIGEVIVPIHATTKIEEYLPIADYISIHVPKQPTGNPVIGANEFAQMKHGVGLVNASRGGIINETDLLAAITTGKVSFAGLDVFENEPNPINELLSNPHIATTPHIGAATQEAQDRIGLELAQLIISEFHQR